MVGEDDTAEVAAACSAALSDDQLITAWTRLLHRLANRSRESAVATMASTTSILSAFGGVDAIQVTYESMQRVVAAWSP